MKVDRHLPADVLASDKPHSLQPPRGAVYRLRQKSIALASRSSIFADWFLVRSRIDRECALLLKYPDLAPPLVAQQLLVSGEDHRHGWHPGFDIVAILRAVWRRLFFGSREGGSTIEQQLVRTITGRYERTFCRKLREIFLAMLVAAHFKVKAIPRFTFLSLLRQAMNGYREAFQRSNGFCYFDDGRGRRAGRPAKISRAESSAQLSYAANSSSR